jgi:hypothetical protein
MATIVGFECVSLGSIPLNDSGHGQNESLMQKPKKKVEQKAGVRQLWLSPVWQYALLLAVLLICGFVRVRLLHFPLERDEGEYAYGGQLILHGIDPYRLCYTMKLPGTAAAYAVIEAIFGQSSAGIHLGFLLVNSATIVLLFFLARRFFGGLGGAVAAATYGLLSLEPAVLGLSAHATQFVVLPAVGGVLMLLSALEGQRRWLFFWSGILLGLAFLMKQPGLFFVFFGVFWIAWSGRKNGAAWQKTAAEAGVLLAGSVLPFALTCVAVAWTGAFSTFWFWIFSYAREYGNLVPLGEGVQALVSMSMQVMSGAPLIWLIATAGVVLSLWDAKRQAPLSFLVSFLVFSFAAVCPGLLFREHYFVLLLPAISLLCAAAVGAGTDLLRESESAKKWTIGPAMLFLLCFVLTVAGQARVFFVDDPLRVSREIYGENPFPEAVQIADYIRKHAHANDRIVVIGSEPEIYFYTGHLSATGFIYMYPLMEPQPYASTMQQQMISEIEATQPRFVVMVDSLVSWLRRPDSDVTIFQWLPHFLNTGYHLVGVADILPEGTQYHWADAASSPLRSRNRVFIYDRETGE